ncbi:MAG: glycosyltransferase [bacterium]
MLTFHIILPHIKKYGGVRRYLEFGNALIKLDNSIKYNIWLLDYDSQYDWIKELNFRGRIRNIKNLNNYSFNKKHKHIVMCGDATSLDFIDKFKEADLRIVNIIFPLNSGYTLGDYSKYIRVNDGKTMIIGNGTGWMDNIKTQDNYYTIPGAINLNMFKPVKINKDSSKFSILFMGRDRPWKGIDDIISLVKLIQNNDSNVDFSYFSTEPNKKLDQLNVRSFINIPQSKMYQIYCRHDCFLSFERIAGWQNTVAEAMACKIPTITTQIGTYDFAIHNRTSLVLKKTHNNKKIVEEALTYLFVLRNNKEFANQIANAGYEQIKSFSWEQYAIQYLDLINKYFGIEIKSQNIVNNSSEANSSSIIKDVQTINSESSTKPPVENSVVETSTVKEKRKNIDLELIEKEAIEAKANQLNNYLDKYYNIKKSLTFDKYEKYGAYHWKSEKDLPYQLYIKYLKQSFSALNEFYGNDYSLIDIGGGDGFISYNLQDYVKSIDIIELNKTAVSLANDKLKDVKKINVYNQDLFKTDLSKYDVVLLSQVIEHFEYPESVIQYLKKFNNKVIIMSTPLARPDGKMWDEAYHFQEFYPDDFIELVKPFHNDYIISLSVIEPHNQIMVMENKRNTLNNYVSNLFFNPQFTPDESMKDDILTSILHMTDNDPKINYIKPKTKEGK